jgi:predicted RND superfamily exporter protein
MLRSWSRFISGRPWFVLLGIGVATLLSVATVLDLRALSEQRWDDVVRLSIDPSHDSLLPSDDPGRAYYDRVRELFGNDETLLLTAHSATGIFQPAFLEALREVTERLESEASVNSVLSLANASNIRSTAGGLDTTGFFDHSPIDDETAEQMAAALRGNPIYRGSIVSDDEQAAAIMVYLEAIPEREIIRLGIDTRIREIAVTGFAGIAEVSLTGNAHAKAETSRVLIRDLVLIVPLALLVATLIAFFSFRTLRGTLVPSATIVIALIWTLALAAIVGAKINVVTISVPALILVIGLAYAMHVVSSYYEAIGTASGSLEAVREALEHVALPTLLTGLTTGAAFASLMLSPVEAVRHFGLHCSIGVACTMLAALTFTPALLATLPPVPSPTRSADGYGQRLRNGLRALGAFDARNRRAILTGGALVAIVSLLLVPRIQVDTDLVHNFRSDSPLGRSTQMAREHLGVVDQVYVVVESAEPEAFLRPENLEQIEALQSWLDEQPGVGGTTSLADYVKLVHRGMNEDAPNFLRIPGDRQTVSQLLLVGHTSELDRLVESQYEVTSILLRISTSSSEQIRDLADRIDAKLSELPWPLEGRVTGNPILIARTADEIVWGQALSLGTSFAIIYLILCLVFTSLRIGIFAMIPNVLPVLVYFGLLGVTGISLNLVTGSVACLVLGIAVDDTIHYLARFNKIARARADEVSAAAEALAEVGPPVTYTSIALCIGFAILGTAELRGLAEFGVLSAITLGVAWLADVVFTPALAAGMRVVTIWDVAVLDLGETPERAIPLFANLSRTQARIAALMFDMVTARAGDRLIQAGDARDCLYVVIDGKLASSTLQGDQGGGRVFLNSHQRGDVVGEVGLLRGVRSADVDCESDVRLLRVDAQNLELLRRRYPRTSARVFQNLSQILAERLVRATDRIRE